MRAQKYAPVCRLLLLFAFCLTSGAVTPPAQAFQVADGMALLRQEMPVNYCALTFDDGPGLYTAALLDLLAERGVVATFFVLGQNAERRPALIKRMLAEGHEVANHSYSHADMRRLSPEAQFLEMKKTRDVLHAFGAEVHYFRPPYGAYTPETVAQAEALGMTIMLWSLDSQDWKRHVSRLEGLRSVSPAVQQSFPGMRGVLLFHDTHKHTVGEMGKILDALTASGCERFVTVSEYMTKVPHEEEHRLSAQVPGEEGYGEMPPPPLAGRLPDFSADGASLRFLEDAPKQWVFSASMRTQAAHPVKARESVNMRTQAAHSVSGGSPPAAASDLLMVGIVANGQAVPVTQQAQSAPYPFVWAASPAASQPRISTAVQGRIPRLLSEPGMFLPAHRPNRGKQDIRRGESNPG